MYYIICKHHHNNTEVYVRNVSFDPLSGPRGTFTLYKHEASLVSENTATRYIDEINDPSYYMEYITG